MTGGAPLGVAVAAPESQGVGVGDGDGDGDGDGVAVGVLLPVSLPLREPLGEPDADGDAVPEGVGEKGTQLTTVTFEPHAGGTPPSFVGATAPPTKVTAPTTLAPSVALTKELPPPPAPPQPGALIGH